MADRASQATIVRRHENLGNQSYCYGVSSPEVDHLAPASDVRQARDGVVLRRCRRCLEAWRAIARRVSRGHLHDAGSAALPPDAPMDAASNATALAPHFFDCTSRVADVLIAERAALRFGPAHDRY